MTSNQRNKYMWMTLLAYTLSYVFMYENTLQQRVGLIIVGLSSTVISIVYLKTNKNIKRIERVVEMVSATVVILITLYMGILVYNAI